MNTQETGPEEQIGPEEAARALSEVQARHRQVTEQAELYPLWYILTNAVMWGGVLAAVDTRAMWLIGLALTVYVVVYQKADQMRRRSGPVWIRNYRGGWRGGLIRLLFGIVLLTAFVAVMAYVDDTAAYQRFPSPVSSAVLAGVFLLIGLAIRPLLRRAVLRHALRNPQ